MKKRLLLIIAIPLLAACQEHFLRDRQYREKVFDDFKAKTELFADQSLFDVFNEKISAEEEEALKFLYAYMPLGDVTDYSGDFYLENVRNSFLTRKKMSWGDSIPELIFRHFVLPVRVNNENLDRSRMIFYEELKDRVKGMSMKDAILEVNHWCHEHVVYSPTDSRTSSPLASMKTAYARCGEESTFTVAALRSVGIPARQVYTPRWAHTDDNHAWVEVWAGGKWYFLGACEPEPVLNRAWFNNAAYRAMLMHTKVFGAYNGPEEVMQITPNHTEINVIDNYCPTDRVNVTVKNSEDKPVEGAKVEYKIYNYAEFYPVACKYSDVNGKSFLSAGKGDLLVWASKDGLFGYRKVSIGKDRDIVIRLDRKAGCKIDEDINVVPPVEGSIPCEVTEDQIEQNDKRLAKEDEIRKKYENTFYNETAASLLTTKLGIDNTSYKDRVERIMIESRGNGREIENFLNNTEKDILPAAIALLEVISEKDLHDTPESVLRSHLDAAAGFSTDRTKSLEKHGSDTEKQMLLKKVQNDIYVKYILNPRISNELITPYKPVLRSVLTDEQKEDFRNDPSELAKFVLNEINIRNEHNSPGIKMFPEGVLRGKVADERSRNIFYVALARSIGIPSRIDPITQKLQYCGNRDWNDEPKNPKEKSCGTEWIDIDFGRAEGKSTDEYASEADKGSVTASYTPTEILPNPKYYTHFTIAKIREDGSLQTLYFDEGSDGSEGDSWESLLKKPLKLDTGHYVLTTGTRMASGKVLAKMRSFDVEKNRTTRTDLEMREDKNDIRVIGGLNPEETYLPISGEKIKDEETSILSVAGRDYFILGIIGAGEEPTNHALKDISKLKDEFDARGHKMILLFPKKSSYKLFDASEFPNLPDIVNFGIDSDNKVAKMIAEGARLRDTDSLPIFCIADSFGRIVFATGGYTIGMGDRLMNVIKRL